MSDCPGYLVITPGILGSLSQATGLLNWEILHRMGKSAYIYFFLSCKLNYFSSNTYFFKRQIPLLN